MDDLASQLQQLNTLMAYRASLADRLEAAEGEIKKRKQQIQADMVTLGTTLFACDGITAEIKSERAYRVSDWSIVHAFIRDHDAFELLWKRVSVTALDEYAKLGGLPPGITVESYDKLNVTPK